MRIIISGKKLALTDAIENYVIKKVNAMEKFYSGIIRADVVLGEDTKSHRKGNVFFAEAKLEVPGYDVFVRKEAGELYAAIDSLKEHLERELKKYKAKLSTVTKKKKIEERKKKEYSPDEV